MNYIAERREEEKERRRAEIVTAAEQLYLEKGWDAVTMDQVARTARLSRALLYVYFRDKEELLFAIAERSMRTMCERFDSASALHPRGLDKITAIGRAYMAFAHEFPHYFDACARFQAHSVAPEAGSTEGACAIAGDEAIAICVRAIEAGVADGSIRKDVGDPMMLAVTLWSFTHGLTLIAMSKANDLAHHGIAVPELSQYAFGQLRHMIQSLAAN